MNKPSGISVQSAVGTFCGTQPTTTHLLRLFWDRYFRTFDILFKCVGSNGCAYAWSETHIRVFFCSEHFRSIVKRLRTTSGS